METFMIEWTQQNKYNPMNSDKGLTYYEHYKKILAWMDGKGQLPAPIEASLDPTTACNNNCYYCSSNRYLNENPTRWSTNEIENIFGTLHETGVKAFCWGGREATLNPRLAAATRMGIDLGMEAAIVTNGVHLPFELMDALLLCKWIGISVDTCDPEVYKKVRGTDDCDTVWRNISFLTNKKCYSGSKTVIGVRALILPETIDTIYLTTLKARECGADFMHIRPADLERKDLHIAQQMNLNMEKIKDIFEKCHELETPDFGVFTITHKYDENFHVKHNFKRCLASPLVVQICADKKMYLCVDHRMNPKYEIKQWGSPEHLAMINSIKPDIDCSRCTWSSYNQQMEEVVIEDKCHLNFP
jgi:sulfatase maturation enzyme AslB (radical SAM superfamily)